MGWDAGAEFLHVEEKVVVEDFGFAVRGEASSVYDVWRRRGGGIGVATKSR